MNNFDNNNRINTSFTETLTEVQLREFICSLLNAYKIEYSLEPTVYINDTSRTLKNSILIKDPNGRPEFLITLCKVKSRIELLNELQVLSGLSEKLMPKHSILLISSPENYLSPDDLPVFKAIKDKLHNMNIEFRLLTRIEFADYIAQNKSIITAEHIDINEINFLTAPQNNYRDFLIHMQEATPDYDLWFSFLKSHVDVNLIPKKDFYTFIPEYIYDKNHENVAVLFGDIVSFSSFMAYTESAQITSEKMLEFFTGIREIIRKYRGWCDRFLGDGIIAYWGFSEKSELDYDMIIRCAYEMIKFSEKLFKDWQNKIDKYIDKTGIRVGVSIGDVRLLRTDNNTFDYTAIGNSINIASRLQNFAEPNTIIVTNMFKSMLEKQNSNFKYKKVSINGLEKEFLETKNIGKVIAWQLN